MRKKKGIEYFPNLAILKCRYNKISSLDVSNNTALTYLDCHGNNLSSQNLSKNINLNSFYGSTQIISIPVYKNGNEYYIELSELPLDLKKVSIDEAWMTEDGTIYNSTSGQINLSDAKDVGDTVRYSYETNGPALSALSDTKMNVTVEISEVIDITEPTTEEPTTEQPTTKEPTTEQPTTEKPAVIVLPTTPTDNSNVPTPKTGDTTPLYLVISLLLVSFAGGLTLYIRRRKKS